jgi:hypothetical protein
MKWFLHACPACGGDLHEDIEDRGWVTCFMCARSFPATAVDVVREAMAENEVHTDKPGIELPHAA